VKDSRPHGQTLTYGVTDSLTSVFFQLEIDEVKVTRNLSDFVPEDRQAMLLAFDLSLENLTSDSLPMSYADFQLIIQDETGKEQILYPLEPFIDGQFPDTYNLEVSKPMSGLLVFQIPKNLKQCQLLYEEIYEDDFKGNRHLVTFIIPE
jgi:hypothetical protein